MLAWPVTEVLYFPTTKSTLNRSMCKSDAKIINAAPRLCFQKLFEEWWWRERCKAYIVYQHKRKAQGASASLDPCIWSMAFLLYLYCISIKLSNARDRLLSKFHCHAKNRRGRQAPTCLCCTQCCWRLLLLLFLIIVIFTLSVLLVESTVVP
jgi:hypothetical protein